MSGPGPRRVTTIWAVLGRDSDDDEGVVGLRGPGGMREILFSHDEGSLPQLRRDAQEIARITRRPLELARFENRTDLETIDPPAAEPPPATSAALDGEDG